MEDVSQFIAGESEDDPAGRPGKPGSDTDLLYQEYARAVSSMEGHFDRVLRVAGIGFAAAGALIFLAVDGRLTGGTGEKPSEWSFWVAPLILTLFYAIIIQLLFQMTFAGYYVRRLEDDVARRTRIPYFHHQHAMIRALFSVRSGDPRSLVTYAFILIFAVTLYLGFIVVCFFGLQHASAPAWRQAIFLCLYLALMVALLWSVSGTLASNHAAYEQWTIQPSEDYHAMRRTGGHASRPWLTLTYAFLPRQFDFVLKSLFTLGAALVTTWILGAGISADLLWTTLLVVLCVDFLAKQATYIWNDILDMETDRAHPHRSGYRLSGMGVSTAFGKALFVVRAAAAFLMAFVLADHFGFGWLPWLVGVIFVWQFFYDRWAKRGPLRRVNVAALGYGERAVAGAMVAMEVAGVVDGWLLLAISAWIAVFMAMVLAEFWWAEHTHKLDARNGRDPGGGRVEQAIWNTVEPAAADWFLRRGVSYQRWATIFLVLVGAWIAYVYADGVARGRQGTRDWASPAVDWIEQRVGDARDLVDGPWSRVVAIRTWEPSQDELGWIGVGAILGTILVILVVRRRSDKATARPPQRATFQGDPVLEEHPDETPSPAASNDPPTWAGRFGWLAALAVAWLAAVWLLPDALDLLATMLALALFGAINYERLTYGEIVWFEKAAREKAPLIPVALDHLLFGAWAVRISVLPIDQPSTAPWTDWLKELGSMYHQWGEARKFTVIRAGGDGGGEYDIIVESKFGNLRPLKGEHGVHVKRECGAMVERAWVNVTSVPVATMPAAGAGLDLPRLSMAEEGARGRVARVYDIDRDGRCVATTGQPGEAGARASRPGGMDGQLLAAYNVAKSAGPGPAWPGVVS